MEKEKQLHFQIHRTSRLIKRYIDNTHTKAYIDNMTGNHGYILGFVYENRDRDIFQRDIEKEFNLRGSTVTNMLNLMEKNGLIERKSVDGDRRLKKIVLTENACEIQQHVLSDIERLEKTITKGIGKKDIEVFFSVLDKINSNIKEESGHD
ncbi:MAG: MarR family winged helix-turn-helix transcriptional regulator [Oscillospiraceae bacterium]|nr:MarR family winged helix-turn-helix transcriptional regulator [Oscillospiraceae bacterium]